MHWADVRTGIARISKLIKKNLPLIPFSQWDIITSTLWFFDYYLSVRAISQLSSKFFQSLLARKKREIALGGGLFSFQLFKNIKECLIPACVYTPLMQTLSHFCFLSESDLYLARLLYYTISSSITSLLSHIKTIWKLYFYWVISQRLAAAATLQLWAAGLCT